MRVLENRTGQTLGRPLRILSMLRSQWDAQRAPALQALADLGHEVVYVDEVLFGAGLHPLRRSDRVPGKKVALLHGMIQTVLREAIEREGSSFDEFYRTPEGQPGAYQEQFKVYGRTGKPCRACGRAIRRLVVGQRGTHICTRCQPAPRPLSSPRS